MERADAGLSLACDYLRKEGPICCDGKVLGLLKASTGGRCWEQSCAGWSGCDAQVPCAGKLFGSRAGG